MRVLHLLEATLGGTRVYLDNIIASSRDLPFENTLVHADERSDSAFPATLQRARDAGWRTIEVPMVRAIKPLADLRAARQVAQVLSDLRPDVLHCHSSKAGGVGRLATFLSRACPLVIYSPHALAANISQVYLMIERLLARRTDRFAAISDSEKTEILDFGLTGAEAVDVIYPLVDYEQYAPQDRDQARRALGLDDGPLVVGIGRLAEQKNPLAFVHTLARLRELGSEAQGIWVGDGELRAAVDAAIRERNLDAVVHVAGWQDDVRPFIAASDVFLSTARFESFGYAVAEALSMERPAVSSAITGTVDVVRDEAAALLYPPGDTAEAATRIFRLLNDKDEARRLALSGRDVIHREFSRTAMTGRIAKAYANAPGAEAELRSFVPA